MCQITDEKSEEKYEIQCLPTITIAGLLASAINGIVGFIAVYLFRPLWQKIVKLWEK